ncbi:MAG: hypothetical protein KJ070_10465 [Verrucomicrobia bacterium]|nr:hypothetical protein [Verrucomicrobiota bacterium]
MNNRQIAQILLSGAALLAPSAARASEARPWTFDLSLYGLAVGMAGDIGVGQVNADVDFGFDKVLDNLEFAMMGKVRLGYDRWALTTDVVYMGLGTSRNGVSVDLDQWMVEPTLSYRVSKYFEPLAGVRYNNLSGEIRGPFGRTPTGTQDWWDPIVGANLSLPLGKNFSFNVRGDIGGFGVGSDLTWQAFPYFDWQFARWGSLQAGYRWLYMDYETGSGASRFKYDMLNQGPQFGVVFHF